MGYRTDVAFCVKPGIDVPKFEEIEDCFDCVVRDERGTLYVAKYVKWYSDYPIVKAVNDFLATLDTKDFLFLELDPNNEEEGVDNSQGNWYKNNFGLKLIHRLDYEE